MFRVGTGVYGFRLRSSRNLHRVTMQFESDSINPEPIYELINAHRRSAVMFAAVELGIFDTLIAHEGHAMHAAELAAAVHGSEV